LGSCSSRLYYPKKILVTISSLYSHSICFYNEAHFSLDTTLQKLAQEAKDIQLAGILNVLWQLLGRTASLEKNLWLVETFLWAFELIQVARGPEHMLASSVQSQD
jgi:hypothetical protein